MNREEWWCPKCGVSVPDEKVYWRFRGHEVEPTDKAIPSCPKCSAELHTRKLQ